MDNGSPGKDITKLDLVEKFPLVASQYIGHRSTFEVCGVPFGGKLIPVMAGPNTVESLEQISDIASAVKKSGAHFLRGGAFKPLSFPYRSSKYFELREQGLEYLQVVRKKFGIPIITEVMEESKIEAVAAVADIVQIGSRNMQNYPLITKVAELGLPLMIKRHYGASLRDWLGAAEYALVTGNNRVILCERGVVAPHTHRSTSRFMLDLQVIPAAQEVTHLPVVSDPSHATFWAPWVTPMALSSIAAGADGLMIEVHPNPAEAAVDPLQPLDFSEFQSLMLKARKVAASVGRMI